MSQDSAIEWTEATWNPVTGCTRASAGCDNCYAVTMTHRLEAMGQEAYAGLTVLNGKGKRHFNGVVRCHEDRLAIPLKRRKPTVYFVNSMSDMFHRDVPFEFIDRVFAVMALTPQHTYQVLTKRPDRMAEYLSSHDIGLRWAEASLGITNDQKYPPIMTGTAVEWTRRGLPGVWLGTSVEDQNVIHRVHHLQKCQAAVQFLSIEPMIGPVEIPETWLYYKGTRQWLIVGGESGPGARPMHPDWVRSLRDQAQAAGVAFFFKQWGAWGPQDGVHRYCPRCQHANCEHRIKADGGILVNVGKKAAGRMLDGRTWDEYPRVTADQAVRQE